MRFFQYSFLIVAFILGVTTATFAQYRTPISFWLNPQFTAPTAMSGSDYHQISAHYQKQALAGNIGGRSMILSGQFPLYGQRNTQFGTVGLNLVRQESGSTYLLSTTGAMLSYNYTARISSQHNLVGGLQAGYYSRRIDWNNVTTENQIRNGQIDPGLGHGERFDDYQSRAFTTNVGLAYYLTDFRGEQRFHLGAGMINANKGRFTYLENDDNQAEPTRWVAYSKLRLLSNPFFELHSNVYWQRENQLNDFVGGLQLNKGINPRRTVADEHLGIGLYYSPDQAATMALQLMRKNLLLGVSYSMPIGNRALYGIQNAAEVTLGWRIQRGGKKSAYQSGNYRGRMPGYQGKRNIFGSGQKSASPGKDKISRRAARAFKAKTNKRSLFGPKKFSKKVKAFKAKANRKSIFKKSRKSKSIFSNKYRKAKKPSYKTQKVKKWKPKKRSLWRGRKRRGNF